MGDKFNKEAYDAELESQAVLDTTDALDEAIQGEAEKEE